jgi:hypothetical protein
MSNFSVSGLGSVYDSLTSFANLSNFWSLFETAFGSEYDLSVAQWLRSQWQAQDFSQLPTIEVISDEVLGNARGAYASSRNVIYLSDGFVATASSQALEAVILEEIGHFVDARVNSTDTVGDEGELFSAIVRGVGLSAAELSRIQAEDDHAVVMIDGQMITVEQSITQVGKWDYLSVALGVAVAGNYAYVVGDTLEILDISNPSNPVFKGNYDIIKAAGVDIQVVGNYAYVVVNGSSSGLQIFNIINPSAPNLTGSYASGYSYSRDTKVQVVGNYAYIAGGYSGLQIFNISNPSAPNLTGSYDTPGYAHRVQVVGV